MDKHGLCRILRIWSPHHEIGDPCELDEWAILVPMFPWFMVLQPSRHIIRNGMRTGAKSLSLGSPWTDQRTKKAPSRRGASNLDFHHHVWLPGGSYGVAMGCMATWLRSSRNPGMELGRNSESWSVCTVWIVLVWISSLQLRNCFPFFFVLGVSSPSFNTPTCLGAVFSPALESRFCKIAILLYFTNGFQHVPSWPSVGPQIHWDMKSLQSWQSGQQSTAKSTLIRCGTPPSLAFVDFGALARASVEAVEAICSWLSTVVLTLARLRPKGQASLHLVQEVIRRLEERTWFAKNCTKHLSVGGQVEIEKAIFACWEIKHGEIDAVNHVRKS